MNYRRFIILCPARSGSTLLQTSLNASPQIICFREPFNFAADFIDYDVEGYDKDSAADRQLRDGDFRAFLQQRIFCEHTPGVRAVGFKAMYNHLPFFPGLAEHLAEQEDIHVIQLVRRNYLRTFASLRIAEMQANWVDDRVPTGTWRLRLPAPLRTVLRPVRKLLQGRQHSEPLTKAVTLTPDECRFYFDWAEENASQYASQFSKHPFLTMYYRDLVEHPQRELASAQSFLGVTPRELPLVTQRQNPEPLRMLIRNYDELEREFRDTPYGVFFEN